MSICPEKDIHSIYLDGELPQEFLKKYESHVASCPKCQAKLERLKKISAMLREDALSMRIDQTYINQSFERLQTKLRFSRNTARAENTHIYRPFTKWAVGFAAAAAVLAVISVPVRFAGSVGPHSNVTAIARTEIKPIQENKVVVDGNLDTLKLSTALSSAKEAENTMESSEEQILSTPVNQNQKVVSATSLASNFSDIDVFRPDFNNPSAYVRIELPRLHSIPLNQAGNIEDR